MRGTEANVFLGYFTSFWMLAWLFVPFALHFVIYLGNSWGGSRVIDQALGTRKENEERPGLYLAGDHAEYRKIDRWRVDLIIIIKDFIITRNNYCQADSEVIKYWMQGTDYLGNVCGIILPKSPIPQGLGDLMRWVDKNSSSWGRKEKARESPWQGPLSCVICQKQRIDYALKKKNIRCNLQIGSWVRFLNVS